METPADYLQQIPHAAAVGMTVVRHDEFTCIARVPYAEHLVGDPDTGVLHGGVIGAFLEMTAVIQLLFDTSCERLPKTIDVSIDYLRSGRPQPTFGRAIVTRHGRRVANVRSEIWQEERSKPIGLSHGHFLLTPI